jgi:hypothetical protein
MFDDLIEQKIQEAIRNGEFDHLPGHGKPLHFEDESEIPPESRMAYRILKNAGIVPEEMQLRKDLASLQALIDDLPPEQRDRRSELLARLNEGQARYNTVIEQRRRS